jgi:eukaryotic-like serine/threonine-protein kinase
MDTATDPFVGKKIGRYQVESVLGRGRGAAVYRGFDPVVNREVAIKVLDQSVARNRQLVDAFLRDTGILAKLRHPHILPIYEVSEHGGTAYFVRQLTDGGTLRTRLQQSGVLSVGEAATILRPVATALDYAHRQGIIHRNLRPTNILLTGDSHPFVTDFSLPGREHGGSAATTVINATTAPEYVSPEQLRGVALDGRSDFYVLAVILYEALVGRPPFRAEGPDETPRTVITRQLQEEPPAPSAINPAIGPTVEAVLLRGLAKDPAQRYPNAAALFYALSEAEEQDRSNRRRQRGNSGPLGPVEPPRPVVGATSAPSAGAATLLPPLTAIPESVADLDDLLATLTDFDLPPAEAPAAIAPPTEATPIAARPPTPASKAVEAPPPKPPTVETPRPAAAQPPPSAAATTRLPLLPIAGGIALIAAVLIVALIAMNRGEQPAQLEATQPAAATSAAASVATAPAATATTAVPQPTAIVAVAPGAVATTSTEPSASAAPTATAAVAASQPPAPLRQEAIVYAQQAVGSLQAQLVSVGTNGQNKRTLTTLPGNAWGPRIAADGRSILFSVGSGATPDQTHLGGMVGRGQHDLYLANLDGSAPIRLTTTNAANVGWSWSPDGKTLAFTSTRDGNWEIYLLSFPSQQVKRLTTNAAQDAWPSWTADGQGLIFMSTRDSYPQLYRMNTDGTGVTRLLTSESSDTGPVVSPDGKRIAYVAQIFGTNDSDIFVANIDGSAATRLTMTNNNYHPTWSPDSTRIAFSSTRDGNYNIYTMNADGSDLTRVTDDPGDEVTPTWGTLELPATSGNGKSGTRLRVVGSRKYTELEELLARKNSLFG